MKRKFNVLQIIETGGPGGAEKVLLQIARNLDRNKFNPSVILPERGWLFNRLLENNIETKIIGSQRSWDLIFLFKLAHMCKKLKIDLIHSHLPDANVYSSLSGLISGVPAVTTYHGLIGISPRLSQSQRLKYFLVRNLSAKVVAVSNSLRDELIQLARFKPHRIKTIYNGVSWEEFDQPFDREGKKHKLGINSDDRVVGMIANLRQSKGYEFFIRAAFRIASKHVNVKFLVIGEEEEQIKSNLKKEVTTLGLSDKVIFLGFREDVQEILRVLDVFILSSISEGMSLATVEAMAAGIPVVVTRSGGPEELVTDGKTGFLVPPKDAGTLAERTLFVLENEKLIQPVIEKAKIEARTRFSIETMIANYEALYLDCLVKEGAKV